MVSAVTEPKHPRQAIRIAQYSIEIDHIIVLAARAGSRTVWLMCAGGDRHVEHGLVHTLGVHVNADGAAAGGHTIENRFPEIVAAFFDPAFAVDAEGNATNGRASLQDKANSIAAVWAVILLGDSLDRVVRIGAVDPLVAVHPQTELELHSTGDGLLADEFEHFQIAVAFRIGQRRSADTIARNVEKEWIGEEQISIRHLADKIVADAKGKVEAIEALARQHRQVARPHLAIVVPGLVFDVAGEEPRNAANGIGRALDNGAINIQCAQSVSGILCVRYRAIGFLVTFATATEGKLVSEDPAAPAFAISLFPHETSPTPLAKIKVAIERLNGNGEETGRAPLQQSGSCG